MTWSATIYTQCPDKGTHDSVVAAVGGTASTVAVDPYTEWQTPPASRGDAGMLASGYWAMWKLETTWHGYDAAMTALGPYIATPSSPDNKYAGDGK